MAIALKTTSSCPPLFDWCFLLNGINSIIDGNPQFITLCRDTKNGDTELAPQRVRVARAGNSRGRVERDDGRTKDVHSPVVIVGSPDLDIQPDDRFNYDNELYRVINVRPHRNESVVGCEVNVRAEAEKVS